MDVCCLSYLCLLHPSPEMTNKAFKYSKPLLTVKFTWTHFTKALLPLVLRPLNELRYRSILLMFHLQGWPCDGYSLPMLAGDKSSLPTCQGHTHHRFTGLSSQVMHGFYSQSVSGSINNKLCEAAANSSLLRPVNPCSVAALTHTGFTWCEHTINLMFSLVMEILIRCLGNDWEHKDN